MARVSIIITTRNRCKLLLRAIKSATESATDPEVIVVDDASTDNTESACATRTDIRYIRLKHRSGVGAARNVGLIASSSNYISFLDDDDLRIDGSIDRQIALLEENFEAGMVYGRTFYGDEYGLPLEEFYPEECPQGDIFWSLLAWNFVPCPSVVFRRDCLRRVGMLETNAPGIEDWDLWVRIAELYPVIATSEVVSVWRKPTTDSGQFTSRGEQLLREARRLRQGKWLKLPRARAATRQKRKQSARDFADRSSQQLIWEAKARLNNKLFPQFFDLLLASIRMYPVTILKKTFSTSVLRSLFETPYGRSRL